MFVTNIKVDFRFSCCSVFLVFCSCIMLYVSIVFVLLFWTFVFAVFYFYSKFSYSRKLNLKTHYVFEDIPTIFDLCNGFNANEIYLLRIIYGDRNKRFFLPSATITVKFLKKKKKCLSSININSSILTDNHRRFLGIKKKPKLLYGEYWDFF